MDHMIIKSKLFTGLINYGLKKLFKFYGYDLELDLNSLEFKNENGKITGRLDAYFRTTEETINKAMNKVNNG